MGKSADDLAPYSVDAEAGRSDGNHEVRESQITTKTVTTWKGYIWDTWELPQAERRLLFKVDAFVLTFASVCLSILLITR